MTGADHRAGALASVLREARLRAGLSPRMLGKRMGVSWVTVTEAECGRNPRHSTLERYLDALPELSPHAILPAPRREPRATPGVHWEYYRDLFGFDAAEVTKVSTLSAEGDEDTVIRTKGLRSLRGSMRDLEIMLGLQRAVFLGPPATLHSIQANAGGITTRVVERREGMTVHQFRFPHRLAQAGITYTRRLTVARRYFMTAERCRQVIGAQAPYYDGIMLPVVHPVRQLRLVLRLPSGYRPGEVRPVVWPTVQVPDPDTPDLAGLLHEAGLPMRRSRGGQTLSLSVEKPLIGLKYGLIWELP